MDDGFIQENREHLEDAYFALDLPEDSEGEDDSDIDESDFEEDVDGDEENSQNLTNKDRKKSSKQNNSRVIRILL